MIRGVYISASGMLAAQAWLDTVAHNVANVNTTGYRRQAVTFAPYLQAAVLRHEKGLWPIGRTGLGVKTEALVTDLSVGPMTETGRSADLALDGDGFFTVEREGGLLYTRAGSFTVNEDGYLVTRAGDPVLGEHGPLYVGDSNFTVTPDGRVLSSAGEELDRLLLTTLPGGEKGFARTPDGYLVVGAGETEPTPDTRVRQGFLEGANVNLAEEMVDLLVAARTYTANQRLVRTHDALAEKAINQVGALR
jgi:flagellar basal-body rod protein FlgG